MTKEAIGTPAIPSVQTVGDAINVARGSFLQFAEKLVADEAGTEVIPGEPPEPKAIEPAEKVDEAAEDAEAEPEKSDDLSQLNSEVSEEEPEEEAEPDHLGKLKEKLPDEIQESVNRRIGKEVAKAKAEREGREKAEARIAEIEAKLADSAVREPEQVIVRPGNNPLANVNDPRLLETERNKAEDAVDQAERLIEQVEDDPEGVASILRAAKLTVTDPTGQESYEPADMKRFLRGVRRNADTALKRHIPERQRYLAAAQQHEAEAVQLMPELKDKSSERYKRFVQVIGLHPAIKDSPAWTVAAAVQVLGLERMDEILAAKKKPAVKAKTEVPAKLPTIPRSTPANSGNKPREMSQDDKLKALLSGDKNVRLRMIQNVLGPDPDA